MAGNIKVEIRKLETYDRKIAKNLVWKNFLIYEAPEYSEEGIQTFESCINDINFFNQLDFTGAYIEDKLVGCIATRNGGSHIALFFVDGEYHKKGIGRKLFQHVVEVGSSPKITVNSSPYAKEVYHKLGFKDLGREEVVDGMRFIPMEYGNG